MRFKKVLAIVTAGALAASLGLMGCSSGSSEGSSETDSQSAASGDTLKVGLWGGSYLSVPVLLAKDQGYFEEEGLNIEWQDANGDGTAMVATGELDIFNSGYSAAFAAIAEGETGITIIGGEMSEGCDYVVPADSPLTELTSVEQLAGLKIAGVASDPGVLLTQAEVAKAGIECEFIPFSDIPDTVTAVEKGEVDMAIVCGAMSYETIQDGCRVLNKVSGLVGTFPCCRIQARTELVNNDPDVLVKYMRAALRGYEYYKNDPDGTAAILADISGQSAETVKIRMYGSDDYDTPMKVSIDPERKATMAAVEAFVTGGAVAETDIDMSEYINTTIYKTALDQLADEQPDNELWKQLQAEYAQND